MSTSRPSLHEVLGDRGRGVGRDVAQPGGVLALGDDDDRCPSASLCSRRSPMTRATPDDALADGAVDADDVVARWLTMVSTAMAVLPVWRSPMISSRWPRPIGIRASMTLMPVCKGSVTGAGPECSEDAASISWRPSVRTGPPPSNGRPAGSTTLPQEVLTDGRIDHPVGAAHEAACVDALVTVEQHDADVVDIEIEDLAESAVVEFDQFLIPDPW